MGHLAEHIEQASYIHLFAGLHIEKRQVNGASPAVARPFGDVPLDEQLLFFMLEIEIRIHADILIFNSQQYEVLDRAHRAVRVEHFQAAALHA